MRGMKSLLGFLIVLGGLGAYIYFVESRKPDSTELPAGPKLFSVKTEAIDEVTVKSSKGDTTTLQKINGTWQVTAPVSVAADDTEVSSLINTLSTIDSVRTVEENPADLKVFGLAEPRIDIGFRTKGAAKAQHLLVGEKTATGGELYAKLPNEKKVLLIAGTNESIFDRTTFDLRQKTVLAFDRDKVEQVEITTPDSTLQLARANGEWSLVKPLQAPADYGTVEGLIGRLQSAQMKSIVVPEAADLKAYGLDKPVLTAVVGTGSARATLLFGQKTDAGTVNAKDLSRPLIFTVEASLLDEVKKPADEYRRKDIFTFRAFNATSIQLTRGAEVLAFEKTKGQGKDAGEKWRETKPAARDIDPAKMETFLTKLANQRAQSFLAAGSKSKTGLDAPVLVVVVRYDDGKKEEKVSIGRAGSDVYAAIAGQPGAAKIDTTEFDDAIKALDALK
ncbi:MAG TPA: DUF4340 domain-containing protein [Vicinamibacterales bacterium]|jgi:hypothetical protein